LARRLLKRPQTRRLATDVWFWAGVRAQATPAEWQRLTKSSYVVFCYHQLSARQPETDPQWHVPRRRFQRQLGLLARLRYTPLTLQEARAFHRDPTRRLGPRRYLMSADDGYLDAIETLQMAPSAKPVAFVVTRFASGELRPRRAPAFADWQRIREASQRSVQIASHTRRHIALVECDSDSLDDELAGSLADLRGAGLDAEDVLAYPYGRHDRRVREATIAAGYALAYTTRPGRNAAGTDPWCLRRISIEPDDGPLAFLWKALTGEALPAFVKGRRRRSRREAPTNPQPSA
jgi:hypothetical protein